MAEMFDENKLRSEIVNTWGPAGVHVEIYDALKARVADLQRELDMYKNPEKVDTSAERVKDAPRNERRAILELAAKVCDRRACEWRRKNVDEAKTDYMKRKTWEKGHEAEDCAEAIRALAGQGGT